MIQSNGVFFYLYLRIVQLLSLKFFNHQVIAYEKRYGIWVFENIDNFFFEKTAVFKIAKGSKFAVECVSIDSIS